MENHPIPQDVTGFQFKLVGNMTIKQFGYVAAGVILAVICYYLPLPGLLKFAFVFLFGLGGVSIAFVPIEGRPMDVMVAHFLKDLLKPNQYIYQKIGGKLLFADLDVRPKGMQTPPQHTLATQHNPETVTKQAQLRAFLSQSATHPKTELDAREQQFLNTLFQQTATIQPSYDPGMQLPQQETVTQQPPLVSTVQELPDQQLVQPLPQTEVLPTQQDAQPMDSNAAAGAMPPAVSVIQQPEPITQPQTIAVPEAVRVVSQQDASKVGLPTLPDTPNLLSGIVKDPRGNVLSGILVEVKNTEGDPVRAFKTNPLGQFLSATKLANGTYTITFEDPKGEHQFQQVQIDAVGEGLPLLEITSVDAREELRRALFS